MTRVFWRVVKVFDNVWFSVSLLVWASLLVAMIGNALAMQVIILTLCGGMFGMTILNARAIRMLSLAARAVKTFGDPMILDLSQKVMAQMAAEPAIFQALERTKATGHPFQVELDIVARVVEFDDQTPHQPHEKEFTSADKMFLAKLRMDE